MTLLHLEARQTLRILRIGNGVTSTWPRDPGAGKLEFILCELNWSFSVLIVISVLIGTTCASYHQRHDLTAMMTAATQSSALTEVLANLVLCKLLSPRLQYLLEDLNNFLRTFNGHERIILQRYTNRYVGIYMLIVIWHTAAIIVFSCGPVFLPIKFPAETWYPFPTESPAVIFILYATHVYSIVLAGFGISVDFMFSMFFCYSAARLEMLWLEMQAASSERQIRSCIKKHQEIIEYVEKVKHVVQYNLFKTNATMGLEMILGSFPVIRTQSLELSVQFLFMVFGACQRLYITAWPADDLKENSEQLAFQLYCTLWFEKSQHIMKDIYFMIQRCQKPLVISMGGLLPTLSLEYYLKYIATTFSYFTTMRAVLD